KQGARAGRARDGGASVVDLAGIEEVEGVEGRPELAHDGEPVAQFARKIFGLALADAMLARAGPFHGDRAFGQSFEKPLNRGQFRSVAAVKDRRRVEIAIPDVADDGRKQARS